MSYQTQLANALRGRGVRVEEYAGWTTRGSSSFTPHGAVAHWTAGPCGATGRPSLSVVVNGRSDLPGPLANVYLDRAGVAVVVAAGKANHAGEGGWLGLSGNSSVFGVEAEACNAGDWTAAQRSAYPAVMAGLCDAGRFSADYVCGHNEWAPSRKIDPHDWPMPSMRSQVGALLRAEEGDWFDMASQSDLAEVVRAELNRGTASGKPDWAATSKAQLPQSQGNTNRLDAITSTLDDVAAAVGARSAGLLASPAVLAVLLFVALLVGLAIGVGIDAE
jgi:hypothetical protein